MPKVQYVRKARKANERAGIEKGQEYWWAGYRLGPGGYKRYWTSPPRPSQIAGSEYRSNVLSIQEEMDDALPENVSDLEIMRDDWAGRISEIAEECRDKLDNIPEGFQQGNTGRLLLDRAEEMEAWADDVDCADVNWNEYKATDGGEAWEDYARTLLDEMASCCPEQSMKSIQNCYQIRSLRRLKSLPGQRELFPSNERDSWGVVGCSPFTPRRAI